MQQKIIKNLFIFISLILNFFSLNVNAIDSNELNEFQNSHFEQINKLCDDKDLSIKETCFLLNSGFFYKSISIINQKDGINYFNECYNNNYNEQELNSYKSIYECVNSYDILINYPFLNKKYNYIFLEEDNIFLNITNYCIHNKNKDINNCIRNQKESFNFFKLNFFNEINHSKKDAFEFCLKQHSLSKYNFDFKSINSCIKKNSF